MFSTIDLRNGYWEVRMREEDVPKIAFKTHKAHYEFMVISFGLTNALTTFQFLKNSIVKPFIRKFVLVFFDNILIYSRSIAEHLQHF